MDLRHLQTFHAVLREGSFFKAARALGLAQPTISLHIQEMEDELGVGLFDRGGRQRSKTAAGEVLAGRALPILDAVDALVRSMAELRDGRAGRLRVAAIEPAASQRLAPLLGRLRAERPGITIQLQVGGTTAVSGAVAAAEADVGLCSAPPAEMGLLFEPLFTEEMAVLLPRSHRLARARKLQAADLDGEPLALTEQGCAYRATVEAALLSRGVRPQWALECGSSAMLRAAVRHRLGLAFLPRAAATPAPAGTVVRRLADLPIGLVVGLVRRPAGPSFPPVTEAFVEALRRNVTTPTGEKSRRRRLRG